MSRPRGVPKMHRHKASNQAVVRIDGKDFYLGPWGTKQAQAAYHRTISQWLAADQSPAAVGGQPCQSVAELVAAYWAHANRYYRKDGRATREPSALKVALRPVLDLYADLAVEEFTPLKVKACRQAMIDAGMVRGSINRHISRIKHMFSWGGENKLIPTSIYHGLICLKGLRKGRGGKESPRRRPVTFGEVQAIRRHLSDQVRTMIDLEWLTGMRPGEVVQMRTCDVVTDGDVWEYRPASFKSQHTDDDAERVVAIGPKAQAILRPWLRTNLEEYLFQPQEAEGQRIAAIIAERTARGGVGSHKRTVRRPARRPSDRYSTDSYRRAIVRACDKAFPPAPPLAKIAGETIAQWFRRLTDSQRADLKAWLKKHRWTPHQLRHAFATRAEAAAGIEGASAALGHAEISVTQIYLHGKRTKAAGVAAKIG